MPDKKKKKEQRDEGLPIWMATFADMMTLLFAFFVLLFSMSTIDPVKVSAMEDAMNANATKTGGGPQEDPMLSISEIKENLEDIIKELNLEDGATVSSDPRGVILELDGNICFKSLQSDLSSDFQEILVTIKEKVMSHPHDKRTVIIEGHSDNQPIQTEATYYKNRNIKAIEVWGTNRHLSASRSSQVVEALTGEGFCLPDSDVDQILKAKYQTDQSQDKCPKESSWYPMGIKPNRLVAAGYGEFWPYGTFWNDVKADNFGTDKCFMIPQTDKEKKMNTPYLWKNINDAESSAVKIITVPKAKTGAYDLNNNKKITKDECALIEDSKGKKIGKWGDEIEFSNITSQQRNKNRRVKIIFSKN